ncbi:MAG: exo-alpha-sialidase [Acidobacteria bacterium]|nr:exo-alpha-sialidase [Acidobacteriota bacterium]
MRHVTAIVLLSAATVTASACGRAAPERVSTGQTSSTVATEWSVSIQPVTSPSGPDSSEPQLAASNQGVILSWVERAGATAHLKFAERTSSGWSQPATVASGNNWFLSYADPPTVLRRPDGTLVASWLMSTNPKYEGSDLQVSYSQDNGKTWARPFMPHHDGTEQQHAFPSFFEVPGNGLGVIWLDGRDTQPSDANPEGGAMVLRYAAYDAQWKRIGEGAVDLRACECCSTTAAVTSDGVLIAFRDRSDKEIRDIAVVRLENGKWTEATPVHNDNWEVYACPVNGPALSARGRQAAVAWFTVKNDQGQAYAAFSNDAGRTWGAPIRLDDAASLGRVDIELLDDGSAAATWVEYANGRAQFRVRRVEPSGGKSAAMTVAGVQGSSSSGFPRLARQGNELVFAWTESAQGPGESDSTLTVHTAVARLPQ